MPNYERKAQVEALKTGLKMQYSFGSKAFKDEHPAVYKKYEAASVSVMLHKCHKCREHPGQSELEASGRVLSL